jgi:adenylate cyclase
VVSVEIERAFVADGVPDPALLGPGVALRQGYVASEGEVEVRLRIRPQDAALTIKAGRGMVRTEVELPLSTDDAEALWQHTEGRRLAKQRHHVQVGDHVAEVDVYEDALAGLCRVEVEFASAEDAAAFEPPAWFGREVTDDDRWRNASLARHGRPDEADTGSE